MYEARLRNVGFQSVKIPWNPDWKSVQEDHETPPPPCGLALAVVYDAGHKRRLAEHVLYGSQERAGSVLELARGGEVGIRAPGSWPPVEEEERTWPVRLQVRLQFSFLYGPAEVNTKTNYLSEPRTFVLNRPE